MTSSYFDVTYLSIDSIQEGVGASQILPLMLGLSKLGKKVSLITFEKREPSVLLVKEIRQHGITWTPQNFGNVGAVGGLQRLNILRKIIPKSFVIHGRSDMPTAAAILSFSDTPILWDVRSLWSDQRSHIGTAGWNVMTSRAARSLENLSARRASAMSTLTTAIIPILERRHHLLPTLREVIPTCVQTSKFLPSAMPSGQVTCLLSGTFNNYYDLERTKQILEAIRKTIDLKVIWARGGESPNHYLRVGEDEIITATHEQMPAIVASSHFGIAICRRNQADSLAAVVPTKIGEFLASGRPVIVSEGIGDFDSMFSNSNAGIVVSENDLLSNVAARLQDILANTKTPSECRELAISQFDMEKAIQKYSALYSKMLQRA